jgi:predicted type IV restriction endonuclease
VENLVEFIKKTQSDNRLGSLEEAAIKQSIILKLLSLLGWDPFNIDEIEPDFHVGNGKVDFLLKQDDAKKIFLSVTKDLNNLGSLQDQLFEWSIQQNIKTAILTNGLIWYFFLPQINGRSEDKQFHTIHFSKDPAAEIGHHFSNFLGKQNVISGDAQKAAEAIYDKRKKAMLIKEHLPKAWLTIINEPEKWLVEIISKVTKELSGYEPDPETVREFVLTEVKAKTNTLKVQPPPILNKIKKIMKKEVKGKTIKSFSFQGKKYDVHSWKSMVLKICEVLHEKHRDDFESILYISLDGRNCFSRNPHEFLECEKIGDTEIYLDLHLAVKDILALCKEILLLFGYKENDLIIESEPSPA